VVGRRLGPAAAQRSGYRAGDIDAA